MLSSSTALSLSNFPPKGPRSPPSPEISTSLDRSNPTNPKTPNSLSLPDESNRKPNKGSAQLKRWSRARAIRLGWKFDRRGRSQVAVAELETRDEGNAALSNETLAKSIYIVSDGTGWTAENSVNAALGQFEYCLVDRGCPVNTHLYSGVEDRERLLEIVKQAAKEGAMVVYTLADPTMAESARTACRLWKVPFIDVLGPVIEAISTHLGVSPLGLPRGASGRRHLTDEYFRRIEAIEFTIKQDDGALPHNLEKADIVLAGVSRTGKTPLSIYLAQKGYKVANVPIVMGVDLPPTLFRVDPRKVFGLIINPVVLQTIRKERAKTLGLDDDIRNSYSEMDSVRRELEHAGKIFAQNPTWPVIEVTGKAVEETAAVVLRLYHDKKNKCSMPGISKRY